MLQYREASIGPFIAVVSLKPANFVLILARMVLTASSSCEKKSGSMYCRLLGLEIPDPGFEICKHSILGEIVKMLFTVLSRILSGVSLLLLTTKTLS